MLRHISLITVQNIILYGSHLFPVTILTKTQYSFRHTFDEHDQTVAYSLSIPFVSTFAFAAVMKHQDAPGTTFKRHMQIAKGVLNEDDYLLQEILFNPYTSGQVAQIREELAELIDIIDHKDAKRMKLFLTKIRNHVKEDIEIRQQK